jgi:signal transduction histidine kinase
MDRLVRDLLDAVRMQSGSLRLELRQVEIGAILRAADEGYGALAEKNGVTLCVEAVRSPLYVHGDEARIIQAVGNLLGNAIKFTRAGGKVSLFVTARSREVAVHVSDTGPGIPGSESAHVFERFWQARKSDGKGVGLGLAIVKGIVDAHGGRIWVESAVGSGSTFAFTLPRCSPSRRAARSEETRPVTSEETATATAAA